MKDSAVDIGRTLQSTVAPAYTFKTLHITHRVHLFVPFDEFPNSINGFIFVMETQCEELHVLGCNAVWFEGSTDGCAIVQAVGSRLRGGRSGTGADFLRELMFPLPIAIPPTAPYQYIIRGWCNRPISGRHTKWTQS
jgi:hypothetical protein